MFGAKSFRIWHVLVLLSLLLLLGAGLQVATRADALAPDAVGQVLLSPLDPADKVESLLRERFAAEGPTDFIVRFAEQADLSPAYKMSWQDRGLFVYEALKGTSQVSQAKAKAYLDIQGLAYETFIAGNDLYVWAGDLNTVEALAEFPEVAFIRATRTYLVDPIIDEDESSRTRGDTQATMAWGIADSKATQFWTAYGKQGDGIVVAGIDTGVQWDHPALVNAFKCPGDPSNAACWSDPSNICGGSACDNNGHGTHTMGTMVADDDPGLLYTAGMAPNARWIACKGCEEDSCSDFALNKCADWLLAPGGSPANRPNIVNNSWGGGGGESWYLVKVNAWRAAGIFPAFSAGNEGSSCSTLGSPGDYQESFGTAAHDSGRGIASFSSRGPSFFGHDPYTKPNISAPGVSICSTIPESGWSCLYSGTSMASPHTAGAVALLWSCNAGLIGKINQTFQILQNSVDAPPTGNCGAPPDGQGNYTFGYGYLNIYAAGQQYCAPPVTATPTSTPTDTPTPTPTFTPRPTLTPLPPFTPNAWVNLPLILNQIWVGPTRTPTLTPSQTPNPTATFTATPSPTQSGGWQTIVAENFEGTFPGSWDVFDNYTGFGEYYWGKRNCRAYAGGFSGWGIGAGAQGSALSCGVDYPNNAEGWMVHGPFSLADATDADMTFKLWLNSELDYDGVCYFSSTDGTNYSGWCTSGNTGGWTDRDLDLSSLVGQSNVWVALIFSSDSFVHYAEGGYVDDILVRKYVGGVRTFTEPDAALPLPDGLREWPVQMQLPLER